MLDSGSETARDDERAPIRSSPLSLGAGVNVALEAANEDAEPWSSGVGDAVVVEVVIVVAPLRSPSTKLVKFSCI